MMVDSTKCGLNAVQLKMHQVDFVPKNFKGAF